MNRIFINFANRYRELGTDTDDTGITSATALTGAQPVID